MSATRRQDRILVLDGDTVNPGDISWAALEEIGLPLEIYGSTEPEQVLGRIHRQQATVVLTNKCRFNRDLLRQSAEQGAGVKMIGLFATGYNNIDTVAARELGIRVCNVPAYSSYAVAQMVFAMLLHFSNQVDQYTREVHAGKWTQSGRFCYWNRPLVELKGKYLGLLGFGSIAQRVARLAEALGMELLCHTRSVPTEWAEIWPQVSFVTFGELLQHSDIISIHCPLFEATRGLFSRENLAKMKEGAYLVNTARGSHCR